MGHPSHIRSREATAPTPQAKAGDVRGLRDPPSAPLQTLSMYDRPLGQHRQRRRIRARQGCGTPRDRTQRPPGMSRDGIQGCSKTSCWPRALTSHLRSLGDRALQYPALRAPSGIVIASVQSMPREGQQRPCGQTNGWLQHCLTTFLHASAHSGLPQWQVTYCLAIDLQASSSPHPTVKRPTETPSPASSTSAIVRVLKTFGMDRDR